MSTFADFALLAAVPAYGGAEILRAQRILPMGPGPRVHLTVLGRNDSITRRIVGAAHAGSVVLHPSLSRIFEICRFDGVAYAVSDPSEGLDLSALLGRTKRAVPYELSLAIVASLARVAVALHDAGGPGSRGGPTGFASVISGGLAPDVIFLEQTGAVRLRPVSSAGIDPDLPSAFRAPEEAISAAADVYSLGRLLMALLTGDVSGLTMPRLSASSTLIPLLQQMVKRRPDRRPPLHETVMRLEHALRERNIHAADQAVRNALLGALKPFVVDPGLGFDAPPHIANELRLRLPYVYAVIERLWPSLNPGFAPAPAVFAALPSPSSPGGFQRDDDEDAPVFADEAPKKRQRARTAATMMIDANDLAAAVAAVAATAAPVADDDDKRQRRGRPTVSTVLIPIAEMLQALPNNGATPAAPPSSPQATVLIDSAGFTPFAPPAPRAAPVPDDDDAFANSDPDAATHELSLEAASMFAREPDLAPRSPPPAPVVEQRPTRPPTLAVLAVFDNGNGDDEHVFDDDELRAPVAGSLYERLQAAEDAAVAKRAIRSAAPTTDAVVDPRDLLRTALAADDLNDDDSDDDDDAIDASEEGAAGFLSQTPQRPVATAVGPAPLISESAGQTTKRPATQTATELELPRPLPTPAATRPSAPPSTRPPIGVVAADREARFNFAGEDTVAPLAAPVSGQQQGVDEGDLTAAFAAAFAGGAGAFGVSPQAQAADALESFDDDDLEEIDDVEAIDEVVEAIDEVVDVGAPEVLDDGAAFVMVGERGATFAAADNPFDQSTRVFAAQAMQRALEEDEVGVDGDFDGDLDGDIDAALDGALPGGSAWAPTSSSSPFSPSPSTPPPPPSPRSPSDEFSPTTDLVAAGAWQGVAHHFIGPGATASQQVLAPAPFAATPAPTMVSPSPLLTSEPSQSFGGRAEPGVLDAEIPRNITGLFTPPEPVSATSELVVEAPVGAGIALNGTAVGIADQEGRFTVDVAADARVVVRVTLAGHAPWSSVVTVKGRRRLRVKASLQPR